MSDHVEPGPVVPCFFTKERGGEVCEGCGKHVRNHFGGTAYRCYDRLTMAELDFLERHQTPNFSDGNKRAVVEIITLRMRVDEQDALIEKWTPEVAKALTYKAEIQKWQEAASKDAQRIRELTTEVAALTHERDHERRLAVTEGPETAAVRAMRAERDQALAALTAYGRNRARTPLFDITFREQRRTALDKAYWVRVATIADVVVPQKGDMVALTDEEGVTRRYEVCWADFPYGRTAKDGEWSRGAVTVGVQALSGRRDDRDEEP